MTKRKTQSEVENIISSYNCLLLDDYKNGRVKMKIKCHCGEIFYESLNNILCNNFCNCEECNKIRKSENSFNEFMVELKEKGYTYKSERKEYVNSKSIVNIECDNGHIFQTSKNRLHSGHLCPKCYKQGYLVQERGYRIEYQEIKERIERNKDTLLTIEEDYKGTKYPIVIKCEKGHIYDTTYNAYEICKCKYCSNKNSKGEERIETFLENNNFHYKVHYRFDDCKCKNPLPFDFYLPKYNICIEYDGIQHFEPIDFAGKEKNGH